MEWLEVHKIGESASLNHLVYGEIASYLLDFSFNLNIGFISERVSTIVLFCFSIKKKLQEDDSSRALEYLTERCLHRKHSPQDHMN